MAKTKQPAAKFRVGYVTATVWKNDNDFYNVVVSRSYKDDSGEYQNTDNLAHGDVMNAIKVLQRAETFIAEQQ